ncbi:peptide deformylase, partial [Neisseria sp. P0009.S008]|uniref:peptide deformylase n=1 Tax=Neisseria sp. P0009.S008 TaxID=3436715 RepID=UPI003F7E70C5
MRDVVALPAKVLRTPSAKIDALDDEALQLGIDIVDTMRVSPGCVGLAATRR